MSSNDRRRFTVLAFFVCAAFITAATAEEKPKYNLAEEKVLYCVGYAHLDTQWRWDFPTTIDRYILDTLDQNFQRFENYPGYVFNFTGSVRYEMMKEYYPQRYELLEKYIDDNRWFVSGSSVDEGDANVPSPESMIRQILYGNNFFRREFGKESVDFMLPDCFGFPASMPSIWAHCGLKGFSTQKLTWGSAVGIPFKIGVWEGPDGNSVIAALDPGPYSRAIEGRVDTNEEWAGRIENNGREYGVFADYHYYGVGDMGGAPREEDVANYIASVDQPESKFHVALESSDQMYKDITPELRERLPRYKGDLLLTEHSAGTLTSQSYMKRWNRKNEQLADAAERAAVAADWLGGIDYPREKLERSWVRALANQMHDILPGTSIPRAYTYSWNDEIVALNGFAEVMKDAVGAIACELDTEVEGIPLVVYNPLAIEREDVVRVFVDISKFKQGIRIYDGEGREVPSQRRLSDQPTSGMAPPIEVLFLAKVPPNSWSVFEIRDEKPQKPNDTGPKASSTQLENHSYRVSIDAKGDVASIIDKRNGDRELLAAPAKLVFTHEKPKQWPAWNMDWADRQQPPVGAVEGPAKIEVIERGPVRATVQIKRESRNSIITQRISLARGDAGECVLFDNDIDWQSAECALKASFPLAVSNPNATYNWGLGTIDRGNNNPVKYEVPSHEWFDLTDASGDYGVSVLEDSKYGSDKPADNEVRLTLLYTPGVRDGYLDQHSQDWGRHDIQYALYGHAGDWRAGRTEWQARRLNQPLRAFRTAKHPGKLGRSFSLLKVNTPQVDVRAIKMAENDDAIIVRLQELWGKPANGVEVEFPEEIETAIEVDGQERESGSVQSHIDKLMFDMDPYKPRTFAVKLAPSLTQLSKPLCQPVELSYNADVVSTDKDRSDGRLDKDGRTIPAEQLPERVVSEGIVFELGPQEDGKKNAVECRGQTIRLTEGDFSQLYILAAATEDVNARFKAGDQTFPLIVPSWTGFIGQWDNRIWDRPFEEVDFKCEGNVVRIAPGYIKRTPVAWFCTHRHHPIVGNEAYRFSYLFKLYIPLPRGESEITLPNDPRIKILAMTMARNNHAATTPAAPLYDDFTGRQPVEFRHVYPPPPMPVHEGVAQTAAVKIDRKDTFDALSMGPPSGDDAIDKSKGRNFVFRYHLGDDEFPVHPRSGADGDKLPRLNDGDAAQNYDDTDRCVWFDNEGRFSIDLGAPQRIEKINTYSWHRSDRAPQKFSLWGSNADEMPSPLFKHGTHDGWTLLAFVNTEDLGAGGCHGTSVVPDDGDAALGLYRHLLWVAQVPDQGTFFTEIDVYVAE